VTGVFGNGMQHLLRVYERCNGNVSSVQVDIVVGGKLEWSGVEECEGCPGCSPIGPTG
jgi:hypothetical protein